MTKQKPTLREENIIQVSTNPISPAMVECYRFQRFAYWMIGIFGTFELCLIFWRLGFYG